MGQKRIRPGGGVGKHGYPKKASCLGTPIVKPTVLVDYGGFFPRDAFCVLAAPYWPTHTSWGA